MSKDKQLAITQRALRLACNKIITLQEAVPVSGKAIFQRASNDVMRDLLNKANESLRENLVEGKIIVILKEGFSVNSNHIEYNLMNINYATHVERRSDALRMLVISVVIGKESNFIKEAINKDFVYTAYQEHSLDL